MIVPGRAGLLEGDFGSASQDGERGAKLVGRIGHEAPHVLDRPLHRGRRLAHEKPSADDDEQERGRRRGAKRCDQRRITILELHLVGDGDRNHRRAAREREALGAQSQRVAAMGILLALNAPGVQCVARGERDPLRGARRGHRLGRAVEEVERPVGNVELLHRIHDLAAGGSRFHLANVRRPFDLHRRIVQ